MTVKELISLLQTLPNQDQRIVLNGYEGGYEDIGKDSIDTIKLRLNINTEWYYGKHEYARIGELSDCEAYVLNR